MVAATAMTMMANFSFIGPRRRSATSAGERFLRLAQGLEPIHTASPTQVFFAGSWITLIWGAYDLTTCSKAGRDFSNVALSRAVRMK